MILQRGNILEVRNEPGPSINCFAANSIINARGRLVMGAGGAKLFLEAHPELDRNLGEVLKAKGIASGGHFGFIASTTYKAGAFQSKTHWINPSTLDLISFSVQSLQEWLEGHPEHAVHLTFPGIGKGGLERADVLPLLEPLPDRVHIWEYDKP